MRWPVRADRHPELARRRPPTTLTLIKLAGDGTRERVAPQGQRPASSATLPSIAGRRSQSQDSSITSGLLHLVQARGLLSHTPPGGRAEQGRQRPARRLQVGDVRERPVDVAAVADGAVRADGQTRPRSAAGVGAERRVGGEQPEVRPRVEHRVPGGLELQGELRRLPQLVRREGERGEPVAGLAGAELAGLHRAEVEPGVPAPGHRGHAAQRAAVLPRTARCSAAGSGAGGRCAAPPTKRLEPREEPGQPAQPVVSVPHVVEAEDQRVHDAAQRRPALARRTSRC